MSNDRSLSSRDVNEHDSQRSSGRSVGIVLADQLVVSGTSFLTAVIVGRLIGPEALGTYHLGMGIVLFTLVLQTSLVSTPWTIAIYKQHGDQLRRQHAGSAATLCAAIASLATVVNLLLLAITLQLYPESPLVAVYFGTLLATTPLLVRELIRRFELATQSDRSAFGFDLTVCTVQLCLVGYWITVHRLSMTGVFAAMALAATVGTLGWIVLRWRRGGRMRQLESCHVFMHANQYFDAGKWILVEGTLGTLAIYFLSWILFWAQGELATGVLAACATVSGVISPLLQGFGNFLFPRITAAIANRDGNVLWQLIRWSLVSMLCLSLAFSIFAFVFGNAILSIAYDQEGLAGFGSLVGVLALRLGLICGRMPFLHVLIAADQPKLATLGATVSFALMLAIAVPAGLIYGVSGVVAAALAGAVLDLGVILWFALRELTALEKTWRRENENDVGTTP